MRTIKIFVLFNRVILLLGTDAKDSKMWKEVHEDAHCRIKKQTPNS